MKTKLCALILGITMLFLWSCSEHSVTPFEQPLSNGRIVGSIHGVVTDFCTNTVFDSGAVKVTWVSNGVLNSTFTDDLGYYIITGLVSGEYVITFSGADDYAISQVTVVIPDLWDVLIHQPATDRDYHHSVTQNIDLFQKNAGVKGKVYRRYNENLVTEASNVTVVIDFKGTSFMTLGYGYDYFSYLYPSKYTVTTDEDGFFEFENLPGAPMAFIYTLDYSDGTNEWFWEEGYGYVYLLQNGTYTYNDIFLGIVAPEPFLLQNNFDNVTNYELATDLFMTFSRAMNIGSFNFEFFYIDETQDDLRVDVEIDTSWTGQTTLTINPFVDLVPGEEYTLSITGEAVNGYAFDEQYTFTTVTGIEFLATNLERAQGVYDRFPVDSNIEIMFSMPVNLNHPNTFVELYDDTENGLMVLVSLSVSADGKTLIITPSDSLEWGHDYSLFYQVFSNMVGDFADGTIEFETIGFVHEPQVVTNFTVDENVMGDSFAPDWNTTTITFRWDQMPGALGYIIWAKDNRNNTDLVMLDDEFIAQDILTWQSGQVTLPAQFDYYSWDAVQTPFLNNVDVTFYITAYYAPIVGPVFEEQLGPLSAPVILSDGIDPVANITGQVGGADRTGTTALTLELDVTSFTGEYLTEAITVTLAQGTNTTATLSAITNWFEWDDTHHDRTDGTIFLTIPADVNAVGVEVTLQVTDTSGNVDEVTWVLQ